MLPEPHNEPHSIATDVRPLDLGYACLYSRWGELNVYLFPICLVLSALFGFIAFKAGVSADTSLAITGITLVASAYVKAAFLSGFCCILSIRPGNLQAPFPALKQQPMSSPPTAWSSKAQTARHSFRGNPSPGLSKQRKASSSTATGSSPPFCQLATSKARWKLNSSESSSART